MSSGSESLWRLAGVRHLLIVSLLGFSSFCLTLAALPAWASDGGASQAWSGAVTTAMLATTVATQGLVPAMLTRFGTGPSLALGLLLLGAPSPLYGLGSGLWLLIVVSAVRGLGFALLTVIGATLTGEVAPPGRHGESIGLYGLAIAVPNLIGVPLGVALTQAGHFWLVAVLAACPVLAIPFAWLMGGRPDPVAAEAISAEIPDLAELSRRTVAVLTIAPSLVLLVITAAGGGLVAFLPIERRTGVVATAGLLLFGSASAIARWRAGLLVDRVGARLLLPGSVVVAAVGLAGAAFALLGGPGWGWDVAALVCATAFGLGYGAVQNLTLVIAFARAGAGGAPVASAVWNAAFDAGTALGAVGVGVLAQSGLGIPWSFVVMAGLLAVFVPLAVRVPRSRPAG